MTINTHTDRLLIRPLDKNDARFILNLTNSEKWIKFIGDRNLKTLDDSKKYISTILNSEKINYHVFELKEMRNPVGIITFIKRDENEFPDLGFAILPEFEKMGYTFEAVHAYLNKIKEEKRIKEIAGITLPENCGSIKLLKKLGLNFKEKRIQNGEEIYIYNRILH